MTAVLSKSFETRTACLNVPAKAPDPLYSFGDRLIVIIVDSNNSDCDWLIHAGTVTKISIEGGEWSYFLDYDRDEVCRELSNFDETPDSECWFSESIVEPITEESAHRARSLIAKEMVKTLAQDGVLWSEKRFTSLVAGGYITAGVAA